MTRHSHATGYAVCILGAAVLLPGCATIESAGSVVTTNGQPFTLTGGGKSLLIEPGAMSVAIGDRPPSLPLLHSKIAIKTRRGEIAVKTRAQDYAADSLTVPGSTHGLSADIVAVWTDHHEGNYRGFTSRDCTYSGWCSKPVQVRVCPRATYEEGTKGYRQNKDTPECRTETDNRDGYHSDCPGTQRVEVTRERYRRRYTVHFLSPSTGEGPLGQFQGESGVLSRQVGERELEPCN